MGSFMSRIGVALIVPSTCSMCMSRTRIESKLSASRCGAGSAVSCQGRLDHSYSKSLHQVAGRRHRDQQLRHRSAEIFRDIALTDESLQRTITSNLRCPTMNPFYEGKACDAVLRYIEARDGGRDHDQDW